MNLAPLVEGRLCRRYKRFLADVELVDGSRVTVHCPNTGAMTGCALPGSRVWLSHSTSKTRKYAYTWELVETPTGLACIHSALANKVVGEALEDGSLPGFEAWPVHRSEVGVAGGSRVDFMLEGSGGRVFIEVKSVTLCREDGCGLFPDAVSARARKHLQALKALGSGRDRAILLFCVFHEGIRSVSAAGEIDPGYRDALADATAGGVEIQARATSIRGGVITLAGALPFALDPPATGQSLKE